MTRHPRKNPRGRRSSAGQLNTVNVPFRKASYPTQCENPGCGLAIRRGDPIVPRPGGGYQHPSCASGADDADA